MSRSEDPGGEDSIRSILEEMHSKMQILCEEISKGRMCEAEAPARAVLRSCSTLRTLSPDTTPTSTAVHTRAPSALISESASVFAETEAGCGDDAMKHRVQGPRKASRRRSQSAHATEAESLAVRLARLEQQRAVDLQQLRSELRQQILDELKPELQALQLEQSGDFLKRQFELQLRGPSKIHRFSTWEAAACEERLEVTRLALAQMQSEVTAQAELLDHVQQQVVELMAPPAMERCQSSKFRTVRLSEKSSIGSPGSETPQAVPVGPLRSVLPSHRLDTPSSLGDAPEVTGVWSRPDRDRSLEVDDAEQNVDNQTALIERS